MGCGGFWISTAKRHGEAKGFTALETGKGQLCVVFQGGNTRHHITTRVHDTDFFIRHCVEKSKKKKSRSQSLSRSPFVGFSCFSVTLNVVAIISDVTLIVLVLVTPFLFSGDSVFSQHSL